MFVFVFACLYTGACALYAWPVFLRDDGVVMAPVVSSVLVFAVGLLLCDCVIGDTVLVYAGVLAIVVMQVVCG